MYFYAHFRRKGGHNEKSINPEKDYVKELIKIIRVTKDEQKLRNLLSDYHEKDIAEAITFLTETERKHLYRVLGSERIAEIFSYFDDAEMYLEELSLEQAAKVISYMDADDALDVLDDLSESKKNEIVSHLDADAQKDVQKLLSYEEDEIGSCMTNNFVCISEELSVREAMSELVRQAGEHDNISTIYVTDTEEKFAGAIDLKDLIIAREIHLCRRSSAVPIRMCMNMKISVNVWKRLQIMRRIPSRY